jgi:hypothetical protein
MRDIQAECASRAFVERAPGKWYDTPVISRKGEVMVKMLKSISIEYCND